MPITFGGLASNLDTNAIVTGLMKAQRIPLDALNAQQAQVSQAASSLTTFLSNVTALQTAARTLSTPAGLSSLAATSTDAGVVVSAGVGAQAGTYSVQVDSLAQETRIKSDPQSSSSAALGTTGTLSVQIGSGAPTPIAIDDTDSLTSIAAKLTSSGARISASVMYDGSQYRLLVRGLDTGAASNVAITESGTALGLDTPANTYQTSTDAQLEIDNIPVTRSTNLIVGVLPGVSFALNKPTAAPSTVSIAADPTAMGAKINTLVSAFNTVVSSAHFTAGYGTVAASSSVLAGDSSIRSTLDRLSRVMSSNVAGTTGKYTTLSSIGLHLTKDGSVQLDQAALTSALAADPQAISRLFVTDATTGSTGAMSLLATTIDALTKGTSSTLGSRVGSLTAQASRLSDDVVKLTARDDAYEVTLRNQFTNLELAMSEIKAQSGALGSLVGLVNSSVGATTTSTG
jgi:flagellar hook-associated protein 2